LQGKKELLELTKDSDSERGMQVTGAAIEGISMKAKHRVEEEVY